MTDCECCGEKADKLLTPWITDLGYTELPKDLDVLLGWANQCGLAGQRLKDVHYDPLREGGSMQLEMWFTEEFDESS